MTLLVGQIDQDKFQNDNPFYKSRSNRETLEELENVWIDKLSKHSKPHYTTSRENIKRVRFGGAVLLTNTVQPRKRFFPNIKIYPRQDNLLSSKFQEILEEIENSKEILALEEGWDGYYAAKIPIEIYNNAVSFLKKYAKFIYDNTNVIIESPEINAGINKNVFLSWRTKNSRLAISFEHNSEEEIIAHYYGDLNNNKEPIKGNVPTNDVKAHLAYWMTNLV